MEEGQINPRHLSQIGPKSREFGDLVVAHPAGPSRIILERQYDVIAEFAGALTDVYEVGEYEKLRSEWD